MLVFSFDIITKTNTTMRFRLSLVINSHNNIIPINYQHQITAWIYKMIQSSNSPMKQFIYSKAGERDPRRKLFTFSPLSFYPSKVFRQEQKVEITGYRATLELSFLMDSLAERFILDLFSRKSFTIADGTNRVTFEVRHIESLTVPVFKETMQYASASPIILTRKIQGLGYPQFINPIGAGYDQYFANNLRQKIAHLQLEPLHGVIMEDFQEIPVEYQLKSVVRSRILKLWENSAWETKVRGFSYKFELTAPAEIHELAYYGGFGEKNALGFGYCNII